MIDTLISNSMDSTNPSSTTVVGLDAMIGKRLVKRKELWINIQATVIVIASGL